MDLDATLSTLSTPKVHHIVCTPHTSSDAPGLAAVVLVAPGTEVLVPKAVDDAKDGEAGGDDHEALVLRAGPLGRDVLVLAPAEHRLVDRVLPKERDPVLLVVGIA